MIIFIDESGVHRTNGHSSFVLVYVEVDNIDILNNQIKQINQLLKLDYFHWADHGWKLRKKYIKEIYNLDFHFKVAIFNNPVSSDLTFEKLWEYFIVEDNINKILIDGKKPRWYESMLKKMGRDKGRFVKKLKTVRKEASEPGLQIADALAGLSCHCFEHPEDIEFVMLLNKFKKLKKLELQIEYLI